MRLEFSKRTMREALDRSGGFCEGILGSGDRCNANLRLKALHFDHIIPAAIGGDNSLQNCQCLCVQCHKDKTAKIDVPMIARARRVSDKYNGIAGFKKKIQSAGFRKAAPQHSASRPLVRHGE